MDYKNESIDLLLNEKDMKSNLYIVILRQIGNVGAHEIEKIKDQPKEGFDLTWQAEDHLRKLFNKKEYPFDRNWVSFAIMKLYSKDEN